MRGQVIYVAIPVDGRLVVREADEGLERHEWGVLQAGLLAAIHADVDPLRGRSNGIALPGGLWARMADDAVLDRSRYPRNPVASKLLAVLGAPGRRCFGTIVLLREDPETGLITSLTDEQLAQVRKAHDQIHRRGSASEPARPGPS